MTTLQHVALYSIALAEKIRYNPELEKEFEEQYSEEFEKQVEKKGIAFITNNMALEINVGMLGIGYSKTQQIHNQIATGETSSSMMNFKVNILSIGMGIAFYL